MTPRFVCRACGFEREAPGRCPTHGFLLLDARTLQDAPRDPLLGSEIAGKYGLVGLLGRGGFGHVYRAWHEVLDRQVAVKVIRRSKARGGAFRERFFLEARAIARLHGPNIVTLHDFGEEPDGRLYMVLEYVDGPTLRQAIPRGTRVPPERAVRLALPVLRALAVAHAQGLVHRDIKPSNLMLTRDDEGTETIKVLDFGVARFLEPRGDADRASTDSGQVVGTPRYVSPEQAAGQEVGPPSDLYSLAVILFEHLAGRAPFEGETHTETARLRVVNEAPPLPAELPISTELRGVVQRALARLAPDRYPTAGAFADALRATPEYQAESTPRPDPVFASASTALFELPGEQSGTRSGPSVGGLEAEPPFSVESSLPRRRRPVVPLVLAGLAAVLLGALAVAALRPSPKPGAVPGSAAAASSAGSAPSAAGTSAPVPESAASVGSAAPASNTARSPASAPAPKRPPRAPASKPEKVEIPYL